MPSRHRPGHLTILATAFLAITFASGAGAENATDKVDAGPAVKDYVLDVGACELFFRVIPGGGTTILMEAGGGMDSSEWQDLAPVIAQRTGATVVVYDRAGFGKSPMPDGPYDMREGAERMWRGLEQLELNDHLILVGHSFGGWLVRLIANDYPAAIDGVVFVEPFSTQFVDLLGVDYLDRHPMTGNDPYPGVPFEELDPYQRATVRMIGDGLGSKCKLMRDTEVPAGVPVVLITAGQRFLPEEKEQEAWRRSHEQIVAAIDGAVMVIAENSGHMVPFTEPELVVEAIETVMGR